MAARVLRVVVGMGVDRVVMVARIGRVDGDERQVAQVLAALEARGLHRVGLGDHLVGEIVGMPCWWIAMSDTAFGAPGRPAGHDLAPWQAHARLRAGLFGLDQFAVLGAAGGAGGTIHSLSAPLSMGTMRPPSAPCGTRRGCGAGWCRCADQAGLVVMVSPRCTSCRRARMRSPSPSAGSVARGRTRTRGSGPSPCHSSGLQKRSPFGVGALTCNTDTGGSLSGSR
jgi:hypothetical protein